MIYAVMVCNCVYTCICLEKEEYVLFTENAKQRVNNDIPNVKKPNTVQEQMRLKTARMKHVAVARYTNNNVKVII